MIMNEQEQALNKKKLNLIKVRLLQIEREIADEIRKYIEKVVASK